MYRYILLILSLISFSSVAKARTIQGIVLSSNDSTAIVGASCRLLTDGKFLTGTSTGTDGTFSLQTDLKSSLDLEVSMTGFFTTSIIIESGAKNLSLGNIYLDEGVTLKDVTVTANPVIKSKGRTIVYPSMADVNASSTSISLFQKLPLPGLQANPITRSIAVDGGSPVILINGVPSSINDINALQPKDIEKIEYTRFTPARYADSGKKGFLNITLKKRNDGGQVYAWGRSAVTTAFVDANVRLSYHQGPSQFVLQYIPSWRNYHDVYDNVTQSYIGDDFRADLESHDRNPFNYHYHGMRLRYDFTPSSKTLLSATFNITPNYYKGRSIAHTDDMELGEYDNNNKTTSKSLSPSLDIFFRQDFNEKNSLEAEVVGTLSSDDYRRDNTYIFADGNENSYIMDVDSRRRSLISEISYIHNFSDKTSLSAGYQNTVSHSTNTYLSSDYKPVLTENNNYAYARLGQSVGNVYFALSTGIKMFWTKNDSKKRHFIHNLSSARFSWDINQSWSLGASFVYSPSIPSLSELTDYPQQTSPYLISNGSPGLKVAENFFYSIEADYSYKKLQVSYRSAFSDTHNSVVSSMKYLGDGKFLSHSVNARYSRIFQNDLSIRITGIYGFGVNLYMSLTKYWTAAADWKYNLTAFDGSINLWWNKGPITISYWRKIPGKYLSGHVVGKAENGDALQIDWQPNKHWTLSANWSYMFDKKGTRYPTWDYSSVNPSYRERYIKNNGNMIVLSVNYSADFGSIFRTGRRSLNNSDNASSLLKL